MTSATKFAMALMVTGLFTGCDPSKAELETTKATLATTTADRDTLKTQVTTLQTQLDAAKKDAEDAKKALADLQAKQAAPVDPAGAPPVAEKKDEKKSGSAKKPVVKNPEAPKGTKDNPIIAPTKGVGAF